jgi:heparan-alpha-glucosaminide N-acetyltransferase
MSGWKAWRTVVQNTSMTPSPFVRLASIDAYRGLVMLLMMAEVLQLGAVAMTNRSERFWAFLAHHQSHVEWIGCSLHDLIQPSFSFLVGAALPFSLSSRRGRGQSVFGMTVHAFWRAAVLVLLGIFLRSVGGPQTYFTFEDTLTQIGLGYGFLFLLGLRPTRDQWIALGLILVGYWAAFALWPLPATDFDYTKVGVPADWLARHGLSGFAGHWNKNSNIAWAADTWLLNLFPRPTPFVCNDGGYATLSFIPTLGTMMLGLLAGDVLRSERTAARKVLWLAIAGFVSLGAGWLLGELGVCPVVKRIWTPSWTLFSGGWCFLFLAAFYTVMDVGQRRAWAFPLTVIGMNSIAAYCAAHLFEGFLRDALYRHLGKSFFTAFGPAYEPLVLGACILSLLWLMLFWMYRRRVFLRV